MSAIITGPLQLKAMTLVSHYINGQLLVVPRTADYEVFVVWFSKTLQNWKALVSTTLSDGRFYEVTYNGDKAETYIDVYQKYENVCIKDEPSSAKKEYQTFITKDELSLSGHICGAFCPDQG